MLWSLKAFLIDYCLSQEGGYLGSVNLPLDDWNKERLLRHLACIIPEFHLPAKDFSFLKNNFKNYRKSLKGGYYWRTCQCYFSEVWLIWCIIGSVPLQPDISRTLGQINSCSHPLISLWQYKYTLKWMQTSFTPALQLFHIARPVYMRIRCIV